MDILTYALAKKYVDQALEGAGALKGKNCVIQNIEQITGGHRITFQWTLDNGTVETDYMDVMDGVKGDTGATGATGATGKGIVSTIVNEQEHLIITYDDGTTQDAGLVVVSGVDSIFTINFTESLGEYSVDKTPDEVRAAYNGGKIFQLKDGLFISSLHSYADANGNLILDFNSAMCGSGYVSNNYYYLRGLDNVWSQIEKISEDANIVAKDINNVMTSKVVANATAVANLSNKQVRNIYAGTTDLTPGVSVLPSGDIYIVYET